MLTLIVAHATFCIVVLYNNVVARLRRLSPNLDEASADLGAHTFQTFRYVTFPLMRTALLAGGLLAFGLSFDEIVVTTFTPAPACRRCRSGSIDNLSRGEAGADRHRRGERGDAGLDRAGLAGAAAHGRRRSGHRRHSLTGGGAYAGVHAAVGSATLVSDDLAVLDLVIDRVADVDGAIAAAIDEVGAARGRRAAKEIGWTKRFLGRGASKHRRRFEELAERTPDKVADAAACADALVDAVEQLLDTTGVATRRAAMALVQQGVGEIPAILRRPDLRADASIVRGLRERLARSEAILAGRAGPAPRPGMMVVGSA